MDITDTLDYDSIDPKTLTAVNTRELDAMATNTMAWFIPTNSP